MAAMASATRRTSSGSMTMGMRMRSSVVDPDVMIASSWSLSACGAPLNSCIPRPVWLLAEIDLLDLAQNGRWGVGPRLGLCERLPTRNDAGDEGCDGDQVDHKVGADPPAEDSPAEPEE